MCSAPSAAGEPVMTVSGNIFLTKKLQQLSPMQKPAWQSGVTRRFLIEMGKGDKSNDRFGSVADVHHSSSRVAAYGQKQPFARKECWPRRSGAAYQFRVLAAAISASRSQAANPIIESYWWFIEHFQIAVRVERIFESLVVSKLGAIPHYWYRQLARGPLANFPFSAME